MSIAIAIVSLLVGALLLVIGWRGRLVDDHPICAACGFDLAGRNRDSGRCPECGAMLTLPRAMRIGNRRRNRKMLATGSILTLVVLSGFMLPLVMQVAGLDWQQHMPTGFLLFHASTSPGRAGAGSQDELLKRISKGQLSASQLQEFATKVMGLKFTSRPVVSSGGKWAYGFNLDWAQPPPLNTIVYRSLAHIQLPDRSITMNQGGNGTSGSGFSWSAFTAPVLPPGDSHAELTFWFSLAPSGAFPAAPGQWQMTFPVDVKIVASGERSAKLQPDESVRAQMTQSIQVSANRWEASIPANSQSLTIKFEKPPRDVAFDVFLHQGSQEWSAGAVTARRGAETNWGLDANNLVGFDPSRSDLQVILRSSLDAAEGTVDLLEIWDGEITLPLKIELKH